MNSDCFFCLFLLLCFFFFFLASAVVAGPLLSPLTQVLLWPHLKYLYICALPFRLGSQSLTPHHHHYLHHPLGLKPVRPLTALSLLQPHGHTHTHTHTHMHTICLLFNSLSLSSTPSFLCMVPPWFQLSFHQVCSLPEHIVIFLLSTQNRYVRVHNENSFSEDTLQAFLFFFLFFFIKNSHLSFKSCLLFNKLLLSRETLGNHFSL